jgi:multisubunit Na+/H+ antiporter MnhB subunit
LREGHQANRKISQVLLVTPWVVFFLFRFSNANMATKAHCLIASFLCLFFIFVNGNPSYYFTQRLDHFNHQDLTTWQQRYLVNASFWDPKNAFGGPIFGLHLDLLFF